jgi:hypothetical protein
MTRFDWDGLRPGNEIFVHHSPATAHRAGAATVDFVTVRTRRGNAVGLRLTDGSVVWPSWLATHVEPVAPAGECWRCAQPAPATT